MLQVMVIMFETYLRLTVGRFGTPPGVFTDTGELRSPSPFLVRAATWTLYRESGCNPEMFSSKVVSSMTLKRIGSYRRPLP